MLSKLLGTQVPQGYKRANPTPAARLLGRLSRFASEILWGRLSPTPLKRLIDYLGVLWSDYKWGWSQVAKEEDAKRQREIQECGMELPALSPVTEGVGLGKH